MDPLWTHYQNVLYPSVYDMEKIENRKMIDALKKKGDALDIPREIEHSFRFRSASSRNDFLKALSLEGFKIISMPKEKNADETFPFALVLSRKDPPQQIKMDQMTQTLLKEALRVNGRYDGWQTFIISKD
ncbi:MAG: ribonuclease E inhibitor RraB [Chitinophagaceae bacterium]